MIPRTLYQIWIGTKPIPEREKHWCAEMAKLNPTWKHTLHGNELLQTYKDDPYIRTMLDRQMSLAFVADRLRILLLRDHGGVYLDADCEPIKPLDSWPYWDRAELDFFAGLRNPYRNNVALSRGVPLIDNTLFGSAKGGNMVNRIAALWSPSHIVVDGHACGMAVLEAATYPETALLCHRFIYAMERFPETLVLHDATNLGSWCKPTNFLAHAPV